MRIPTSLLIALVFCRLPQEHRGALRCRQRHVHVVPGRLHDLQLRHPHRGAEGRPAGGAGRTAGFVVGFAPCMTFCALYAQRACGTAGLYKLQRLFSRVKGQLHCAHLATETFWSACVVCRLPRWPSWMPSLLQPTSGPRITCWRLGAAGAALP